MMRDVAVVLALLVSVPVCVLWPWAGAVTWGWLGFMLPHRLVSGLAFGVYLGWIPVVATLVGLARAPARYPLPRSREMRLMLVFWAFCVLTTVAATQPQNAWPRFVELSRILVMMLAVMALSLERRRLELLMWLTALVLAWYALEGAAWVCWTGGAEPLYGPRASDIENNNDLAPALISVLPFFVFLGRHAPRAWMRRGALVLFAVTIVAILGTYSRGAVLGLGAVLLLLTAYRQWRGLAMAAIAFSVFFTCTNPQKWFDRVGTIFTYTQDKSASMRLDEWYVALRIGLDHPLLGAGFRPFTAGLYQRYIPGSHDYHDAHNLFLQVFAEHGFPGLALYVAVLGSTLLTLRRIARSPPTAPRATWSQDCARMLLIGLVGYVVDGLFECLSYRANLFDLLALSIMLNAVATPTPLESLP
jgi:probable O-glycosylation ligase (exosortase A-associated)